MALSKTLRLWFDNISRISRMVRPSEQYTYFSYGDYRKRSAIWLLLLSWRSGCFENCIEGFSTGGTSGSPVFAVQRGFKVGGILTAVEGFYCEVKVISINAGHFYDLHRHSGISYLYKSSAILDIIDSMWLCRQFRFSKRILSLGYWYCYND